MLNVTPASQISLTRDMTLFKHRLSTYSNSRIPGKSVSCNHTRSNSFMYLMHGFCNCVVCLHKPNVLQRFSNSKETEWAFKAPGFHHPCSHFIHSFFMPAQSLCTKLTANRSLSRLVCEWKRILQIRNQTSTFGFPLQTWFLKTVVVRTRLVIHLY